MPDLPTGTVTFLFTDLEGSTRLWDEHPEPMTAALARHDEILHDTVASHGGQVVKTTGDGVHAVFVTAEDAIAAAVDAQRGLAELVGGPVGPLRVRMGIHTGAAQLRDGDYYGSAVNRAARLMSAAHGGQILVSHATEELARDNLPEDTTLLDLGEHTLRDLARPERVFQVAAGGVGTSFPALQTLDRFPGNLQTQVTSFVGRERELAAIVDALGGARLVTLTGVGGVGKTRLAQQAAAEVVPQYRDGAWLCELAAAQDGDAMTEVVASALGVAPRVGMSLEASVLDWLQPREALVVLDNCEHLLDAASRLAEGVLRECPAARVLATSREVLAVPGEQVIGLRSLPVPDADTTDPETIAASDAVRLFVDRARAARAGFHVDEGNEAAVGEICRRLDGIPLALELAAARVAAMSAVEIASLLDERFRLLTGGRRTAVERHQTLRATVEWSYSLLEPHERRVFDRLGVFAGTFDATAARDVASGVGVEEWDVLDALASLVAKSMLTVDETTDGTTRYGMLETLRAYARERLEESGEADVWRRRHADHFARFAEDAGPELLRRDELVWRPRVRADTANLRAAVAWALDSQHEPDAELALRILAALAYEVTLDRSAGFGMWAEHAVDAAERSSPARRSAVLACAAVGALHRGDVARAAFLIERSVERGVPADCPTPLLPYIVRAVLVGVAGRNGEAIQILEEAERSLPPDDLSEANLRAVMTFFRFGEGDLTGARDDADVSLAVARRLGSPSQLAISLSALGWAVSESEPATAMAALEESLALTTSGASDVNRAQCFYMLARLRSRLDDRRGALEAMRNGVAHSSDVGDRLSMAATVETAIDVLAELRCAALAAVLAGATYDGCLAPISGFTPIAHKAASAASVDGVRSALGNAGTSRNERAARTCRTTSWSPSH
jgi:predicted ATPase/class 3 adenylate cyclase